MALGTLVKREIKAFLKNPGFIISIILLLVFFAGVGEIMKASMRQAVEEVVYADIGVIIEDDTEFTRMLVNVLNETMVYRGKIRIFSEVDQAIASTGIVFFIPEGFTRNATSDQPLVLRALFRLDRLSTISMQSKLALVSRFTYEVRRTIPIVTAELYGIQRQLEYTVDAVSYSLYGGRVYNAPVLLGVLSFILMVSLFIGIIIGVNAGYGAQLVAYEKTEKAFEMLLAQPIKRRDIVIAKIIGSSVATLIFGLAYVGGILLMMFQTAGGISAGGFSVEIGEISGSATSMISLELGFDVGLHTIIAIGVSIVIGLLQAGTIGVILGALSPDERTAAILISPTTMLFIGIALVFVFLGIDLNYVTAILSGIIAIPLPMTYILSIITGEYTYIWISLASGISFFVILALIANYLFNRDIVVLGLKISLRKTPSTK